MHGEAYACIVHHFGSSAPLSWLSQQYAIWPSRGAPRPTPVPGINWLSESLQSVATDSAGQDERPGLEQIVGSNARQSGSSDLWSS